MAYPPTLHHHHNPDWCFWSIYTVRLLLEIFDFGGNGPQNWQPLGIMAKELMPIICRCIVWGPKLAKKSILFQCDNLSLVTAINKGSCKDILVMQLLRILTLFVTHFDMHITSTCITGTINVLTNYLSRFDMSSFFYLTHRIQTVNTTTTAPSTSTHRNWPRLDICILQEAVQWYLGNGIVSSTKRMYASGIQHYMWSRYNGAY